MTAANEHTAIPGDRVDGAKRSTPLGAYGLELPGIADNLLLPAPPHWPPFELVRHLGRSGASESYYTHSAARIVIQGDSVVVDVDRDARRAVYTTPRPVSDDALVHPYLAPVAAVAAVWLDRQSFHGGGFIVDGG